MFLGLGFFVRDYVEQKEYFFPLWRKGNESFFHSLS